jgi:hypothetical protein
MLEIATGLLVFLVTTHSPQNIEIQSAPKENSVGVEKAMAMGQSTVSNTTTSIGKAQSEIQQKVKSYFVDIPLLSQIAGCESHYNQFSKDGSIFRGEINNADVGVMQINEYYHLQTSKSLGYDIHTLAGNMAYARYLYEREGSAPWISSSYCWKKYENVSMVKNQLALAKK